MNNRSMRHVLKAAALSLVIFGFSGIFFLGSTETSPAGTFWENWYPLLIPSVQMSDDLQAEIFSLSPSEPVSISNTVISYLSYNGSETVSLIDFARGEGPNRFDPRIDPWMTGISDYFHQDIYEIFYLPNTLSPLEYRRAFENSEILGGVDWILPDDESSLISPVLFAAVILLLCIGCFRFIIPGGALLFAGYFLTVTGQDGLYPLLAVTALLLRLAVTERTGFSFRTILPF
ncbi:MAG: hypothetical protein PQJ50_09685, partial [Spirochaetales bacterium]|nr:hypothetical protein [Spirochaetales bacterium]